MPKYTDFQSYFKLKNDIFKMPGEQISVTKF